MYFLEDVVAFWKGNTFQKSVEWILREFPASQEFYVVIHQIINYVNMANEGVNDGSWKDFPHYIPWFLADG